jgi:hypothetical protein
LPITARSIFLSNQRPARYYAKALLACLHRSIAIPEWANLRNGDEIPLANALGAFDLFIPESRYGNFDEVGHPNQGNGHQC